MIRISGLDGRRDRERQTCLHSLRVRLEGLLEKAAELGELRDVVLRGLDLAAS